MTNWDHGTLGLLDIDSSTPPGGPSLLAAKSLFFKHLRTKKAMMARANIPAMAPPADASAIKATFGPGATDGSGVVEVMLVAEAMFVPEVVLVPEVVFVAEVVDVAVLLAVADAEVAVDK